jgi:hypothetical protein
MFTDPDSTPVTIPVADPTRAIEVLADDQEPPPLFDNVIDDPTQTTDAPEIEEGNGLTVTIVVYTVVGEQPSPVLLNVNE